MNYPIKRNGYIYARGTREGFLRMQRQGIPRPLFSLQDRLAKVLNARYRRMIRKLMGELKARLTRNGITLDASPEENLDELLEFFSDMGEEARKENQKIADKANMQFVANELENEWFNEDQEELERLDLMYEGDLDDNFRPVLEKIFRTEQDDYLAKLKADAGIKMQNIIESFEINKNKFFEDNMAAMRTLYIDNSLQRIKGEEDLLKRKIISRIIDYATGKTDTLILNDLTKECYEGSDHLSRLFARDQMQRFNKACTLSTFKSAGVTKVKWMTANDGRVRNKDYRDKQGRLHRAHTKLQGMVFSVNDLPLEIDDYNCRCGLIPVEWADD